MEATIVLEYADEKLAKAVADAVSPDNFKTPLNLSAKTMVEQRKVTTVIHCEGKLTTFTATIDDLLFSATAAEKALKAIDKTRK